MEIKHSILALMVKDGAVNLQFCSAVNTEMQRISFFQWGFCVSLSRRLEGCPWRLSETKINFILDTSVFFFCLFCFVFYHGHHRYLLTMFLLEYNMPWKSKWVSKWDQCLFFFVNPFVILTWFNNSFLVTYCFFFILLFRWVSMF